MVDVTKAMQGNSAYLKAADIENPITVVIEAAGYTEIEEQDGSHTEKILVKFRGAKKGLLLNLTNINTIAHLYGRDTDEWIGKPVTLVSEMVPFGRKIVPAVRVKPPNGGAPAKQMEAPVTYQKPMRAEVPPVSDLAAFDDEVPF